MPSDVSIYSVVVWLLVGLFTGFGWGVGTWIASKLTR